MSSIVIRAILAGGSVGQQLGDPAALLGEINLFLTQRSHFALNVLLVDRRIYR